MMTEHKTVSIADQIFEQLERDILAGEYERGEILTEAKLSAERPSAKRFAALRRSI